MASSNQVDSGSPKLVILALVLALAAVVLVNVYIGVVQSSAQPGEFTVFQLRTELQPGDELEGDDVKAVQVPNTFKPAFQDAVKAEDVAGEIVPARVGDTIQRPGKMNEILTYSLFRSTNPDRLDKKVDENYRAITLLADENSLATLKPGMYVDLLAPFNIDGKQQQVVVMEGVKVLSIGSQNIAQEPAGGNFSSENAESIRIQVKPYQVPKLAHIADMATRPFNLVIRNPADREAVFLEPGQITERLDDRLPSYPKRARRD